MKPIYFYFSGAKWTHFLALFKITSQKTLITDGQKHMLENNRTANKQKRNEGNQNFSHFDP
jgi:hypothetical protein